MNFELFFCLNTLLVLGEATLNYYYVTVITTRHGLLFIQIIVQCVMHVTVNHKLQELNHKTLQPLRIAYNIATVIFSMMARQYKSS